MSSSNNIVSKYLLRHVLSRRGGSQVRSHHPDPFNPKLTAGWKAALSEAKIPTTNFESEIKHALELGLPGASSLTDKTIPTFSRGELPHFAGINTFLKAPYIEDAKAIGSYDVTVLGYHLMEDVPTGLVHALARRELDV